MMIKIASDFSPYPGGRYRTDGAWNGQAFREEKLVPALQRADVVTVDLDDVRGLPPSFLEEAFGGLLRDGFKLPDLEKRLKIEARSRQFARYPAMIWQMMQQASGNVSARAV
ncbi:hypothetical protein ABIE41_002127 [Bosea sp. OAE506]|uniref:STAS-like domain-containing protein n=1 Tax=Bosea sp. OAE506 TaxID=2663870 RepID=UPI00178A923E